MVDPYPAPGSTKLPFAVVPLALTYLAIAINMTIASIALPTISTEFEASAGELAWIVNVTPMVSAAFLLFAGTWSDRFGRKRMLMLGVCVFLVSAFLSGLAGSVEALILLRALTGLGSAIAMPAALALTFDVTSGNAQRTAVGIMGGTQAIGVLLGPLVGGAVLVAFGWHAAFWAVTPILLFALIFNWRALPPDREIPVRTLDSRGAALSAVVGIAFLYIASSASSVHPIQIVLALTIGVVALVLLIRWERRAEQPLFDGVVMRNRSFQIATLGVFAVQFTLGGLLFLNTQYVQLVLGFSAFGAGLFLMPALLSWTASSASAGIVAKRFSVRTVVAVALLISAVGLAMVSSGGVSPSYPIFIAGLVLLGAMGVVPALMTHTAVSVYSDERRSIGSSINSMATRYGLAFGIAAYGVLQSVLYRGPVQRAAQGLSADDQEIASQSLGGAISVAKSTGDTNLVDAAREAFASGYSTSLMLGALASVVLALVVWRLLPDKLQKSEGVITT